MVEYDTVKMTAKQQECHDAENHEWEQVAPSSSYFCYSSIWTTLRCKNCDVKLYIEIDVNDLVQMVINQYKNDKLENYVVN